MDHLDRPENPDMTDTPVIKDQLDKKDFQAMDMSLPAKLAAKAAQPAHPDPTVPMDNRDLLVHLETQDLLEIQEVGAASLDPAERPATLDSLEPLDKPVQLASLVLTALLLKTRLATRVQLDQLAAQAAQDNLDPPATMVALEHLVALDQPAILPVLLAILVPLAHLATLVNLAAMLNTARAQHERDSQILHKRDTQILHKRDTMMLHKRDTMMLHKREREIQRLPIQELKPSSPTRRKRAAAPRNTVARAAERRASSVSSAMLLKLPYIIR
jgi:hypothetical protein